jgi:predicted component of type VI protein secretion system
MTNREKVERASKAEDLLRNEVFQDAFSHLEKSFYEAWRKSQIEDTESRERVYQFLQNLDALRGYFQTVIEDGKLAQMQIDEIERQDSFNNRHR